MPPQAEHPRIEARPAAGARPEAAAARLGAAALPLLYRLARRFWPIPRLGSRIVVTRHDDVVELFRNDADFGVPMARIWR